MLHFAASHRMACCVMPKLLAAPVWEPSSLPVGGSATRLVTSDGPLPRCRADWRRGCTLALAFALGLLSLPARWMSREARPWPQRLGVMGSQSSEQDAGGDLLKQVFCHIAYHAREPAAVLQPCLPADI